MTGARRARDLAADPGRFLSTVQIGITLVGVLSGAFSAPRSACGWLNFSSVSGWPLRSPMRSASTWWWPASPIAR